MESGVWALPAINAVAASLLLNSGVSKMVSSGPPRRALAEVVPALSGPMMRMALRGVAVVELMVAVALPLAWPRITAAVVTLVLGMCFTLLGGLGIARHSKAPCGCFGASGRRPLGLTNIFLGAVLATVYPLNLVLEPDPGYSVAALAATAASTIMLCMYMRRELVVRLLWPRRGVLAESETR